VACPLFSQDSCCCTVAVRGVAELRRHLVRSDFGSAPV
jgi:hypothetical protein